MKNMVAIVVFSLIVQCVFVVSGIISRNVDARHAADRMHERIIIQMKDHGFIEADEIEKGTWVEAPAEDWEKKWTARSPNTSTSVAMDLMTEWYYRLQIENGKKVANKR